MTRPERLRFAATHPRWAIGRLRRRSVDVDLAQLARYVRNDAPIVVEAGACDGSDTALLAERWPEGHIHAFEPVPDAMALARQRTAHLPNVTLYDVALSDQPGSAQIHLSEDQSGSSRPDSSSLLAPGEHLAAWPTIAFRRTLTVQTVTLDGWAAEQGVEAVDFMWLDMQGMELPVLRSAPRLVARTQAVYTEVFRSPLYERAPLYDEVVSWMRSQGFRVAIDRVGRVTGNMLFIR